MRHTDSQMTAPKQPKDSQDTPNNRLPREKRLSVRLSDVLLRRIDDAVAKRQEEFSKYCVNDWIRDAAREKLDGTPGPSQQGHSAAAARPLAGTKRTAADLAASIPGVARGLGAAGSGEAPVESEGSRFIRSLLSKTEGDANEDLLYRTGGELPPGTMGRWYYDRHHRSLLAAWIDENYSQEGR